ncbi:hypothetical protein JXA40_08745 [bacterium]|nr:hypothetical protein [candidate division CSSED10-310 bacterium]
MNKKVNVMAIILMGCLLLIGVSGCGDAGGAAKSSAPVTLIISNIADQMYESDVCHELTPGFCSFVGDENVFTVRVDPVSPDEDIEISRYMDVVVTGYEVKYFRKDTGTMVPKTFTGNTTYYCEVDTETDIDLIFCRADMKNMPPLSYLWQFGYDPETGLSMIHTTCEVTIWGHTVGGKEVVSKPAHFTVNFANYADDSGGE